MGAASGALEGEVDGLLSAHSELAQTDLHSPEAVAETVSGLEVQLSMVTERRELVETRLREIKAVLVERYKGGTADVDDWLR